MVTDFDKDCDFAFANRELVIIVIHISTAISESKWTLQTTIIGILSFVFLALINKK